MGAPPRALLGSSSSGASSASSSAAVGCADIESRWPRPALVGKHSKKKHKRHKKHKKHKHKSRGRSDSRSRSRSRSRGRQDPVDHSSRQWPAGEVCATVRLSAARCCPPLARVPRAKSAVDSTRVGDEQRVPYLHVESLCGVSLAVSDTCVRSSTPRPEPRPTHRAGRPRPTGMPLPVVIGVSSTDTNGPDCSHGRPPHTHNSLVDSPSPRG